MSAAVYQEPEPEDDRTIQEITQTDYSRPWSPRMMELIAKAKADLADMKKSGGEVLRTASTSLERGAGLMTEYFTKIPAEQLSAKIKATFNSFDTNGDGTLSPGELEDALAEMGHRPTTSEMQDILDQFDTDKNGTIELDEFEHMVRANLGMSTDQCPCRLCDAEKKKAWELQLEEMKRQQEEKDREILKNARAEAHEQMKGTPTRETHIRAGEDEVKHLTPEQRKAFTPEEAEHIEQVMRGMADLKCSVKDSVIHTHEVLEVCSGILVTFFASIPQEELSERIKDKFHQFDLDNSGTLDQDELGQALAEMGRKPSKEELHDLFEMFDGDGNGTIELDEFEHMVRSQLNVSRDYCPCSVCEKARIDAVSGRKSSIKKAAKDAKHHSTKASSPVKKKTTVPTKTPVYAHVSK